MYSIWQIMCFLNIKACQNILLHQIMIFKKASYDPFKKIVKIVHMISVVLTVIFWSYTS